MLDPHVRSLSLIGCFLLLFILERVFAFRSAYSPKALRLLTNLGIAAINAVLISGLLGGLLLQLYSIGAESSWGLLRWMGAKGWGAVLATVVLLDLVTYAWHWAYHRSPLLWRLHRVHHSDLDLDVTSSLRFHLLEMALSAAFRLGVILLLGFEVQAVLVFELIFGVCNQFVHSNLKLPEPLDRLVRGVLVTPSVHRVHHSQRPAQTHSNFGTIFSFWDRLFGTWRGTDDSGELKIGLPDYPSFEQADFKAALLMPFRG